MITYVLKIKMCMKCSSSFAEQHLIPLSALFFFRLLLIYFVFTQKLKIEGARLSVSQNCVFKIQ